MEPQFLATFDLVTPYHKGPADLYLTKYFDGTDALLVTEAGTHEQILKASVNLGDYGLAPHEGSVFIKDYSENEGVLDSLIDAGLVSDPIRVVSYGFVQAYECAILTDQDREDLAWAKGAFSA